MTCCRFTTRLDTLSPIEAAALFALGDAEDCKKFTPLCPPQPSCQNDTFAVEHMANLIQAIPIDEFNFQ